MHIHIFPGHNCIIISPSIRTFLLCNVRPACLLFIKEIVLCLNHNLRFRHKIIQNNFFNQFLVFKFNEAFGPSANIQLNCIIGSPLTRKRKVRFRLHFHDSFISVRHPSHSYLTKNSCKPQCVQFDAAEPFYKPSIGLLSKSD